MCKAISKLFKDDNIRIQKSKDGAFWFAASDVCSALEYKNYRQVIKTHCRAKGVQNLDTLTEGGKQKLTYIDEGNLYRLIIKSSKPKAKDFESWVCDEILPELRQTGSYSDKQPSKALPKAGDSEYAQYAAFSNCQVILEQIVKLDTDRENAMREIGKCISNICSNVGLKDIVLFQGLLMTVQSRNDILHLNTPPFMRKGNSNAVTELSPNPHAPKFTRFERPMTSAERMRLHRERKELEA